MGRGRRKSSILIRQEKIQVFLNLLNITMQLIMMTRMSASMVSRSGCPWLWTDSTSWSRGSPRRQSWGSSSSTSARYKTWIVDNPPTILGQDFELDMKENWEKVTVITLDDKLDALRWDIAANICDERFNAVRQRGGRCAPKRTKNARPRGWRWI